MFIETNMPNEVNVIVVTVLRLVLYFVNVILTQPVNKHNYVCSVSIQMLIIKVLQFFTATWENNIRVVTAYSYY
jgi:ABC-type siderophore export system fused ATPase/permease subunit